MSENQDQIATTRHDDNINESQIVRRSNNQARVIFSPKKCWICLSIFELNENEYNLIQSYYFNQKLDYIVSYNTNDENKINKIRLILIMNKFILSICKCKKKLAHIECFNNYVDLKQNGNISIDIFCQQCKFKYEFDYPLNCTNFNFNIETKNFNFKIFKSSFMTVCFCATSTYWCCLTYGVITVIQLYGYKQGFKILNESNNLFMFGFLPIIPIALVASRFIPISDLIDRLLPTYSITELSRKIKENGFGQTPEDEDEKEDEKFLSKIRLVVGGLLLPTIAISIDRIIFNRLNLVNSAVMRTAISGVFFIGVKNVLKTLCTRKKIWQQMNRDIKNYVCD